MEARAIAKNVKVTPRKARLVVDLIRNKNVQDARAILKLTNKQACEAVIKILNSAVANATETKSLNADKLFIKTAYVNDGIRMKRLLPRAKGKGDTIIKRFSNITIVVAETDVK